MDIHENALVHLTSTARGVSNFGQAQAVSFSFRSMKPAS